MRQINEPAILVQAAATVNSAAIPALNLFYCSAQLIATGGAAGTFKLQASNDDPHGAPAQIAPTNWNDIPSATVAVTGAGSYLIPKTELCYQWVRVVYTNTGAGTIAANFKGLGE